ncbi:glycine/D-amino acid oxidase-like deaminating enzyme [Bradyrhizobium sp. LA6.10]|uniref:NAD(P)/FAD-dependent oxidoreductase n=1 Tax=Bradyrhizobium sp. LA6.10 TaxID=3156318 RepID=UPI0033927142
MNDERHGAPIIVVGAGIVGLCTSLSLLRAGRKVVLMDMGPPGTGASFGNSGLLSVDTAQPMAVPGMLRHVPGWLSDPFGPVTVRPSYALKAAPWLMKWVLAGRMDRVRKSSHALRALHKMAYERYTELLGASQFSKLVRQSGVAQLWETETETRSDAVARELRDLHNVESQELSAKDLADMFPGISPRIKRGLLLPRNGFTPSPAGVTGALFQSFLREGGEFKQERVLKLLRRENGYELISNVSNQFAHTLVIAAGAWSSSLLATINVSIPLEAERGYHLMLTNCSLNLKVPIMHRGRGFGLTPMAEGMSLCGTIEFGGVDRPPSERRAIILRHHAEKIFPGIRGDNSRIWMGLRPSFPDSVPAIGYLSRNLFVAIGHGHYGMVGGPATGRLAMELIEGRKPHIDPFPYRPERFGGIAK